MSAKEPAQGSQMKRVNFDLEILMLVAETFVKIQGALSSGELSFNDEDGFPNFERAEALIKYIDILGAQMADELDKQRREVNNVPMSGLWTREDTPEG